MQIKLRKGDNVKILAGKDRGKSGLIERVFPKKEQVVVTGVNLVKKHRSPRRRAGTGGILTAPAPLPVSRVMVICPHCQKATRVGIQINADGSRVRMCKRCHEVFVAKES